MVVRCVDEVNMKVSVVIAWTNKTQVDEAKKYLEKQTIYSETEVVLLDNRNNKNYRSAAEALNRGGGDSHGDILVFMHQDVYLWEENVLEKYYEFLMENQNAIIGVAGATSNAEVITDIYEPKDKIIRGKRANGKITQVESLDECMFAMCQDRWNDLRFDEACCNDWHCYAVEICLNNRIHGGECFVVPAKICHDSLGNSNQIGFIHTVKNLIWKYQKTNIHRIESTCVSVKCSKMAYWRYCSGYYIKSAVKNLLRKIHERV